MSMAPTRLRPAIWCTRPIANGLIEMEQEFDGEKLAALFLGGDLIVTLHTGNMFESATLSPERDRELLGKTIAQFGSMHEWSNYSTNDRGISRPLTWAD